MREKRLPSTLIVAGLSECFPICDLFKESTVLRAFWRRVVEARDLPMT